jgi:hypothetical protein
MYSAYDRLKEKAIVSNKKCEQFKLPFDILATLMKASHVGE